MVWGAETRGGRRGRRGRRVLPLPQTKETNKLANNEVTMGKWATCMPGRVLWFMAHTHTHTHVANPHSLSLSLGFLEVSLSFSETVFLYKLAYTVKKIGF